MHNTAKNRYLSGQRRISANSLAESPLALLVMSVVILFMISMFSLLTGYATLNFASQAAAREAGSSQTRTAATAAMQRVASQIIGGPLGQFGGISPKTAAGMTLRTFRVLDGGTPERYDVAAGSNIAIDQTRYSYTYVVDARYSITPLLFPFAFPVQSQSTCALEHPEGIAN
jgi:hypothetical protein